MKIAWTERNGGGETNAIPPGDLTANIELLLKWKFHSGAYGAYDRSLANHRVMFTRCSLTNSTIVCLSRETNNFSNSFTLSFRKLIVRVYHSCRYWLNWHTLSLQNDERAKFNNFNVQSFLLTFFCGKSKYEKMPCGDINQFFCCNSSNNRPWSPRVAIK